MAEDKILKMIDRMAEYIDDQNIIPLSKDRIKISKERLLDFTDELRQAMKVEFEEAKKVNEAKNEILRAAKSKAAKIEAKAEEKINAIIQDDEIVIAAEREADYIIENAEKNADNIVKEAEEMAARIKLGALSYAEEMLATVEKMVSHNLDTVMSSSNSVTDTLKNTLEIVKNNRSEIKTQIIKAEDDFDEEDTEVGETEEEFTVNVNSDDFEDD
ncbi:MAG: hypothetical protein ACTTKP_08340 [Catonella sp.]|uniref:hypothetical protein n=1 Tax=Catonella sp. TaxID=2382125 RepID=UPI003FA04803